MLRQDLEKELEDSKLNQFLLEQLSSERDDDDLVYVYAMSGYIYRDKYNFWTLI